ncbi:MAG: hypothetical protein ACREJB_15840, partial [Planctomycetaceae bacterium]
MPLRRRARRRNTRAGILVGAVVALLIFGVGYAVYTAIQGPRNRVVKNGKEPPKRDAAYDASKQELTQNAEAIAAVSPTSGEPIELLWIPSGTSIVIHLRPAELWQPGLPGEEVRACLGPLAQWAEAKIKEHCLFEPAEIEELLLCIALGPRGSQPELSGVVRLTESQNRSELIKRFAGTRDDSLGLPFYAGQTHAYAIDPADEGRTFAFCPVPYAQEMLSSQKSPMPTDSDLEEMLFDTDRERHLTILFAPADLRMHQESLVAADVLPLLNEFLDRLGDDVEALAWSVHLGETEMHSDILLRNKRVTTPTRLHRDTRQTLEALPHELYTMMSSHMDPQTVGGRRLIGRFPAMMEAYQRATLGGIDERSVR